MRMTILEQLNMVLTNVGISQEARAAWSLAIKYLKNREFLILLKIMKQAVPEEIRDFSANLTRKIAVLRDGNPVYWEEIIREEKRNLQ